jgi:hypothetical protein
VQYDHKHAVTLTRIIATKVEEEAKAELKAKKNKVEKEEARKASQRAAEEAARQAAQAKKLEELQKAEERINKLAKERGYDLGKPDQPALFSSVFVLMIYHMHLGSFVLFPTERIRSTPLCRRV